MSPMWDLEHTYTMHTQSISNQILGVTPLRHKRNLNHKYQNKYHVWDSHPLLEMLDFKYETLNLSNEFF